MAEGLTRAELRTWVTLTRAIGSLFGALDRQLRDEHGISHDDYQVLSWLHRAPNRLRKMSDLARDLGYSPSRLSHAMRRFGGEGWVERRVGQHDRRVVEVRLTDSGSAWVRRVSIDHLSLVRRLVFDPLEHDDIRQLGEAMRAIARASSPG